MANEWLIYGQLCLDVERDRETDDQQSDIEEDTFEGIGDDTTYTERYAGPLL